MGEPLAERLALDIWHDVEEGAVHSPGIVDREDVRVLKSRGEADLAEEAIRPELSAGSGAKDLDRDRPVVAAVDGPVHHRRGAAAHFVPQLEASLGEPLSKTHGAHRVIHREKLRRPRIRNHSRDGECFNPPFGEWRELSVAVRGAGREQGGRSRFPAPRRS